MQVPTKALLAIAVLGGVVLPVFFEASTAREEQRLFNAGRYDDAGRAARKIHLMKFWLVPRLSAQVERLGETATARALPFLDTVASISGDPVLIQRVAAAKTVPDPARLAVVGVGFKPLKEPVPLPSTAPELFRAVPAGDQALDPEGGAVKLERLDGKDWKALGDGFGGPLGNSFDLSQDGHVLWLARQDKQLQRIDLTTGKEQLVPLAGAPGLVALAPGDPDRLAFSQESPEGDVAYVWDHGTLRRLFPAADARPAPGLAFEWADDGKSLALRWEDQAPDGVSNTQLVWVRADGAVGLEGTLEGGLADNDPNWVPAPGGVTMGLAAGGAAWAWTDGQPKAVELPGLGGIWGFDPAGKLVAGLDGASLVLVALEKPAQRISLAVPDAPKAFEAEPGSFRWARDEKGDRISVSGGVPTADGTPTTVTVKLQQR
ncbi:MAG: hypothetical protein JWM80_2379 [Cyanobacteria bacterium RYN_339]|nr:hypothetical protein [Cyanobacteria bacterium RYN_339]